VRDIIDWQWLTDGESIAVDAENAAGEPERCVSHASQANRGRGIHTCDLRWGQDVPQPMRLCFVGQLPSGLRKARTARRRLSALLPTGELRQLTNLDDSDVARIGEQRLSPLYVSVHAVDPDVRKRLVCATEDLALQRFDELLAEGIDLHAQIVLVPGENDGAVLDETLRWLASREGVASVGVVPLGFTRYQQRFSRSYSRPEEARKVIDQVRTWQQAMSARDGVTWVYLADEFYLNADIAVPAAECYDDFPQYENGIGIVRTFLDDAESLRDELAASARALDAAGVSIAVVTGELAAPLLREVFGRLCGALHVLELPNAFFGGNVSVAGLLVGTDLVAAIREHVASHEGTVAYLLPSAAFNADGVTLDDMALDDLRSLTGSDIRVVSCDAAALHMLSWKSPRSSALGSEG
jgi:putative radical SAM enzyme (TIGR03279 family)